MSAVCLYFVRGNIFILGLIGIFGTYLTEDVTVLLKDITGLVKPLPAAEREPLIQGGVHYSEMLPLEYEPSEKYLETYYAALSAFAKPTAYAVAAVSRIIWEEKGRNAVIVSLARAGTPVGILIKRYIKSHYGCDIPHYTISIIRGRGIDKNAIKYILSKHSPENIRFVDGWVGKGAIARELRTAVREFDGLDGSLAVLSDPAYITEKCGTREDILIASSCLNSTVSGLLSRTFLRSDIIGKNDFHGAAFYRELLPKDLTYQFIGAIEKEFPSGEVSLPERICDNRGLSDVEKIREHFGVTDINFIKPGIGEATRVLLRRVPWKILVNDMSDVKYLGHIFRLAEEKNVPVERFDLEHYRACGIIKALSDI